jgi:PPM family protein phosphatase
MQYQLGQSCRLGNREMNEDHVGLAETDDAVLLVLADGMGGYSGGKIASGTLVSSMLRQFKKMELPVANPQAFLKELVAQAHIAVMDAGKNHEPPLEPRTTCVVCLIQEGCAWWAHVGDSRLYLFRDGKAFDRTIDHSKIEELRRKGRLTEAEMEKHPQRHLITRCIGFEKHPPIPAISTGMRLDKNDMLLLCSDGLWGSLNDDTIAKNLIKGNLDQVLDNLTHQAEDKAYPNSDNISVIAFEWLSEEPGNTDGKEPADAEQEDGYDEEEVFQTLDDLEKVLGRM